MFRSRKTEGYGANDSLGLQKFVRCASVAAASLFLAAGIGCGASTTAGSTPIVVTPPVTTPPATPIVYTGVNAYTGPITDPTEILSPYFAVHAVDGALPGPLASMTNLYTYQAQIKSVNFIPFTSPLTGLPYNPDIYGTDPRGPYTSDLGIASFASFQPLVPATGTTSRTSTITVTFPTGYPVVPITTATQIRMRSNVTANRDGTFNATGTGNVGAVTVWPAGNIYGYPAGSFSFTVTERTDSTTNHGGIPQQLTIEVSDGNGTWDFLNSLHVFCNPHPDATNTVPATHLEATPSVGYTLATIPTTGGTVIHFAPGTYWLQGNGKGFYNNREFWLDDGAMIKYYVPAANGARVCGTTINCGPMLDLTSTTGNMIFRGWGIVDGTSIAQQAAYSTTYTDNRDGKTYPVSANCGDGPNPLTLAAPKANTTQSATVDGVVFRNSCTWTLQVYEALGTATIPVTINNVKIFGYGGANTPGTSNADGMDIVEGEYLNITNSFIRTSDDLITLKQNDPTLAAVPTTNVNVVNNTLWNGVAHAMVAGEESFDAQTANGLLSLNNVVFDSDTIIHDTGKGQQMGVAGAYSGLMENITFSNIVSMETVGLFHLAEGPGNITSNIQTYSMAPTSLDSTGKTYQSVVTFTLDEIAAPVLQVGQSFVLSGQSSWKTTAAAAEKFGATISDGKGNLVNHVYTISSVGSTLINSVLYTTMTTTMAGLPLASSATQTGTEGVSPNAFPALTTLNNPGRLGATKLCNITQTNPQSKTNVIVGAGYVLAEPYVSPVSNMQMEIGLNFQDPYVAGQAGYPYGTYPQSIYVAPQISNIVVAKQVGSTVVMSPVSTAMVGNDWFYLASDGLGTTNPATFAPDVIEETVRVRDYNAGANVLFDYGSPSVVAADMTAPQFLSATTACPVSPWLPVAQTGW